MSSAAARERQAVEGKQLIEVCKEELERLEKQIFHVGKTSGKHQDAEEQQQGEEGGANSTEESHPLDPLREIFQVLEQATGAATSEEVLNKFRAQKNTLARLVLLRKQNEAQKQMMEIRKKNLEVELEKLKYLKAKDIEMYH